MAIFYRGKHILKVASETSQDHRDDLFTWTAISMDNNSVRQNTARHKKALDPDGT